MIVFVVDDEKPVLSVMASALTPLGHAVSAFSSPCDVVASLTPDVDLVISDVSMPEMDGFQLAEKVAQTLGDSPPRTLLMTGRDPDGRLASSSTAAVIGLLYKPFSLSNLYTVLHLLEQTRTLCPGRIGPFCASVRRERENPAVEGLCESPHYATCPHYDTDCGRRLRDWISTTGNWESSRRWQHDRYA